MNTFIYSGDFIDFIFDAANSLNKVDSIFKEHHKSGSYKVYVSEKYEALQNILKNLESVDPSSYRAIALETNDLLYISYSYLQTTCVEDIEAFFLPYHTNVIEKICPTLMTTYLPEMSDIYVRLKNYSSVQEKTQFDLNNIWADTEKILNHRNRFETYKFLLDKTTREEDQKKIEELQSEKKKGRATLWSNVKSTVIGGVIVAAFTIILQKYSDPKNTDNETKKTIHLSDSLNPASKAKKDTINKADSLPIGKRLKLKQ